MRIYMTQEEFGLALFETIKSISGIEYLRKRKRDPKELLAQLPGLMTQLSPADTVEIVKRYPWVSEC